MAWKQDPGCQAGVRWMAFPSQAWLPSFFTLVPNITPSSSPGCSSEKKGKKEHEGGVERNLIRNPWSPALPLIKLAPLKWSLARDDNLSARNCLIRSRAENTAFTTIRSPVSPQRDRGRLWTLSGSCFRDELREGPGRPSPCGPELLRCSVGDPTQM